MRRRGLASARGLETVARELQINSVMDQHLV